MCLGVELHPHDCRDGFDALLMLTSVLLIVLLGGVPCLMFSHALVNVQMGCIPIKATLMLTHSLKVTF